MAAPAWATDLTDIWVGGSISSWSALGGGASGLNQETDYFIQGVDCCSKNAWTNALKGMIYDNGGSFAVPTDGAIVIWGYYAATNSLDTKTNGGLRIVVGSSASDYWHYYVAGKDTLAFDSWIPYVVNPDNSLEDNTDGTPSGTEQWVGGLAYLPTSDGPTKGSPLGWDAIRYGRCRVDYMDGEGGNYNTFAGAEAYGNAVSRRWGLIELIRGVYRVQGFHRFGVGGGNPVNFVDANKTLIIRAVDRVTAAFNRFEIQHASSVVDWTNIAIVSLSTVSPGTFAVTAGALTADACQFVDMGAFTLLSSSEVTGSIFRRCGVITAPGSTLTDTQVLESTVAADASALVWDVNTDLDGKIDGCTFTRGANAHHAIELGTNSPLSITIRGVTFSGFSASDGQNDSVLHVKRTVGTVTIGCVGCTGTVTYKSDGATVNITQGVAITVHVQDAVTGGDITGARVLAKAASGGPYPFEESVSIVRSGSTVTVTHTGHAMATNDWAVIAGCNEGDYNGVWQITKIGADSYSYDIGAKTPSSPATGLPVSTFAMIHGTTDGNGNISDTRTYAADQPFTGRVRKASASPFYKSAPFSGTVDSATGASLTVQMVAD